MGVGLSGGTCEGTLIIGRPRRILLPLTVATNMECCSGQTRSGQTKSAPIGLACMS